MKKPKTGGRVAGTPNKLTVSVKSAFEATFNELQSDPRANLLNWGRENPTYFYQLAAKLIPTEIKGNLEHKVINVIVADEK